LKGGSSSSSNNNKGRRQSAAIDASTLDLSVARGEAIQRASQPAVIFIIRVDVKKFELAMTSSTTNRRRILLTLSAELLSLIIS
jgi:hypothetical protein